MEGSVDHEARKMASLALQRIEGHEKFCEERARKSEIFEADMRGRLGKMDDGIAAGLQRIHQRLDAFQRTAMWTAVMVIVGLVGAILMHFAGKLPGA